MQGGKITEEIRRQIVKNGDMYTVQWVIEGLALNDVIDLYFDLSAITRNRLQLHESVFRLKAGSAIARFYLPGSTAAGGTAIASYNRNENSDKTAEFALSYKTNKAATNIGTALPTKYMLAGGTTPLVAGQGAVGDDILTEVNKGLSRVLRISTQDAAPVWLDIRLIFSEED